MRILYLVEWFSKPEEPGLSRPYQFARRWTEAGHSVYIITSFVDHLTLREKNRPRGQVIQVAEIEGINVIRVWSFTCKYRGLIQRILLSGSFTLLDSILALMIPRPDVVIGSSPPTIIGLLALALARRYQVPFIYEVRDMWPQRLIASGQLSQGQLARIITKMEQICLSRANGVVLLSEGDKKYLLEAGYSESRLLVIPHGVDDWMETSLPRNPADSYCRHFTCLYAGAYGPFNCLQDILDAAYLLKDTRSFKFILVGDGDNKVKLAMQLYRREIHNVELRPITSKKKIFSEMVHSDACILTSGLHPHYAQWLPNKIFDYMASGTPVVASATGELASLIKAAGGGLVVPPGDPSYLANGIQRLAEMPKDHRNAMGKRARLFVLNRYLRRYQASCFLTWIERRVKARAMP